MSYWMRRVLVVCHIHGECDRSLSHQPKPRVFWGTACRDCGKDFNSRRMRSLGLEWFILDGMDPPTHYRELWLRCGRCKNLYDLQNDPQWFLQIAKRHCVCPGCGKALSDRGTLQSLLTAKPRRFKAARDLSRFRQKLAKCPHCKVTLAPIPWCPICASLTSPPASDCLPIKGVVVWRSDPSFPVPFDDRFHRNPGGGEGGGSEPGDSSDFQDPNEDDDNQEENDDADSPKQ